MASGGPCRRVLMMENDNGRNVSGKCYWGDWSGDDNDECLINRDDSYAVGRRVSHVIQKERQYERNALHNRMTQSLSTFEWKKSLTIDWTNGLTGRCRVGGWMDDWIDWYVNRKIKSMSKRIDGFVIGWGRVKSWTNDEPKKGGITGM